MNIIRCSYGELLQKGDGKKYYVLEDKCVIEASGILRIREIFEGINHFDFISEEDAKKHFPEYFI